MATALQKAGVMESAEVPQIDRSYTVSRVEWMLENYHALLSARPMSTEDKAQMSSVVTSNSQWWNAQAYWRKVDRKADLDAAIDNLRTLDGRMHLIIELRYRGDPFDRPTWEDVAASLATSRSQIGRLYIRALCEIAWYLGGISDA